VVYTESLPLSPPTAPESCPAEYEQAKDTPSSFGSDVLNSILSSGLSPPPFPFPLSLFPFFNKVLIVLFLFLFFVAMIQSPKEAKLESAFASTSIWILWAIIIAICEIAITILVCTFTIYKDNKGRGMGVLLYMRTNNPIDSTQEPEMQRVPPHQPREITHGSRGHTIPRVEPRPP
jgi:hypothetical protein